MIMGKPPLTRQEPIPFPLAVFVLFGLRVSYNLTSTTLRPLVIFCSLVSAFFELQDDDATHEVYVKKPWQLIELPEYRSLLVTKLGKCGSWAIPLDMDDMEDLFDDLCDLMMTRLPRQDLGETGWVYIMQDEEHLPSFFKVGISQDVRRRRTDILSQCGLWGLQVINQVEVACRRRVEKLVHPTLSYFTDKMPCIHDKPGHAEISPGKIHRRKTEHTKTGKQKTSDETTTVYHREWFWCNLEVVNDVVSFWVRWMGEQPYRKDRALTDSWSERVLDVQNMERGPLDDTFGEMWETSKGRIETYPPPKRGRRRRKTLA